MVVCLEFSSGGSDSDSSVKGVPTDLPHFSCTGVVFWDNRIPHANSYRNDPPVDSNDDGTNCDAASVMDALGTSGSRAVVYCSFLPDVDVNRRFVQRQLEDWKLQRAPRVGDRWIRQDDDDGKDYNDVVGTDGTSRARLNEVGKRLIGLVEWT